MSTRCQIGIYERDEKDLNNWKVLLYRHWDGYPEGVIPDVTDFLVKFKERRGIDDYEYCGAQLICHLINGSNKENKETDGNSPVKFLGYGICKEFHADIEYYYAIYPGYINIYNTKRWDTPPRGWKKIQSILIDDLPNFKILNQLSNNGNYGGHSGTDE